MRPKTRDVLALLEKFAPLHLAESWDNSGLQVGSLLQKVTRIFMSLDPTIEAITSAADLKAQILLTHHPLIFSPLSQIDPRVYPGNIIEKAFRYNISIIAAHTNLDVAKDGINDILAKFLMIEKAEPLHKIVGETGAGLGRIGNLRQPRRLSDVIKDAIKIFGISNPRVVGDDNKKILRVAVIGGSGGGSVLLAAEKKADLLITGDVGHHHALEAAAQGIALMDAGHFNTEKIAFNGFAERFEKIIMDQGWDVEVKIDSNEVNPFRVCQEVFRE